jgi:hypothetical protein
MRDSPATEGGGGGQTSSHKKTTRFVHLIDCMSVHLSIYQANKLAVTKHKTKRSSCLCLALPNSKLCLYTCSGLVLPAGMPFLIMALSLSFHGSCLCLHHQYRPAMTLSFCDRHRRQTDEFDRKTKTRSKAATRETN